VVERRTEMSRPRTAVERRLSRLAGRVRKLEVGTAPQNPEPTCPDCGLPESVCVFTTPTELEQLRARVADIKRIASKLGWTPEKSKAPETWIELRVEDLYGAIADADRRLTQESKRAGVPYRGRDTAHWMAEEILGLRAKVAEESRFHDLYRAAVEAASESLQAGGRYSHLILAGDDITTAGVRALAEFCDTLRVQFAESDKCREEEEINRRLLASDLKALAEGREVVTELAAKVEEHIQAVYEETADAEVEAEFQREQCAEVEAELRESQRELEKVKMELSETKAASANLYRQLQAAERDRDAHSMDYAAPARPGRGSPTLLSDRQTTTRRAGTLGCRYCGAADSGFDVVELNADGLCRKCAIGVMPSGQEAAAPGPAEAVAREEGE
jgi:hypothetical protein